MSAFPAIPSGEASPVIAPYFTLPSQPTLHCSSSSLSGLSSKAARRQWRHSGIRKRAWRRGDQGRRCLPFIRSTFFNRPPTLTEAQQSLSSSYPSANQGAAVCSFISPAFSRNQIRFESMTAIMAGVCVDLASAEIRFSLIASDLRDDERTRRGQYVPAHFTSFAGW